MHTPNNKLTIMLALLALFSILLSSCGGTDDKKGESESKREVVLRLGDASWAAYQQGWDQPWIRLLNDVQLRVDEEEELGVAVRCKDFYIYLFQVQDIPPGIDTSSGNVTLCDNPESDNANIEISNIAREVKSLSTNHKSNLALYNEGDDSYRTDITEYGSYRFVDLFEEDNDFSLRWNKTPIDIHYDTAFDYEALEKDTAKLDGVLTLNALNKQAYYLTKTYLIKFGPPLTSLEDLESSGIYREHANTPFRNTSESVFDISMGFEHSESPTSKMATLPGPIEGLNTLYLIRANANEALDKSHYIRRAGTINNIVESANDSIDFRIPEFAESTQPGPPIDYDNNTILFDYQALGVPERPNTYSIYTFSKDAIDDDLRIYLSQDWLDAQSEPNLHFAGLENVDGFDPLWTSLSAHPNMFISAHLPNTHGKYGSHSEGVVFPSVSWWAY